MSEITLHDYKAMVGKEVGVSRWFDVSKWQGFAAEQVSRELRLSHVWSWGWAQRNERSNDPDKTYAACVWLWARDSSLCNAPKILGRELDADRKSTRLNSSHFVPPRMPSSA